MSEEAAEAFFETFDAILLYPVFAVNVALIFLSLKYVPSSLSQIYSLNIAIPSLICCIYKITRNIVTPSYENDKQDVRDWLPQMLLLTTTFNIYQFQGTLTIVLTYFSFVKPVQYQKFYTERTVRFFVFGGHVAAFCLASIEFPERIYKPGLYSIILLDIHTTIRCGTQMFLFITMFVFYLLTFYQVVFKKDNAILVQTIGADKYQKQKNTIIKSVLIYFTPPVLLLLVSASGSLCIALKAMAQVARGLSTGKCPSVIKITDHMVMLRFFVNTLSALIAFSSYREGIVKCYGDVRAIFDKNANSLVRRGTSTAL